jgi:predicted MFS family arabinose efflux permease
VAAFNSSYPGIWGWRWVFITTDLMCIVSLVFWWLFQTSDIVDVLNTPVYEKLQHSDDLE